MFPKHSQHKHMLLARRQSHKDEHAQTHKHSQNDLYNGCSLINIQTRQFGLTFEPAVLERGPKNQDNDQLKRDNQTYSQDGSATALILLLSCKCMSLVQFPQAARKLREQPIEVYSCVVTRVIIFQRNKKDV